MMATTSENRKHKTTETQTISTYMLEKIVELLTSIAASLATLAANCGGAPLTLTAETTTAPETPATGGKRGAPSKEKKGGGTPTPPAANAVTYEELKGIIMPWLGESKNDTEKKERIAAMNKLLDPHRDSPNVALQAMDPAKFAILKPLFEELAAGKSVSSDDCPI